MRPDIGPYAYRLLVAFLFVGFFFFLLRIIDVLLLAFAAVLLAVLLRGLADWIGQRLHLSTGWLLALAILILVIAIGVSVWLFGREVSAQVDQLTRILPEAWDRVRMRLQDYAWGRGLLRQIQDLDVRTLSEGVVSNVASVVMTTLGAVGNLLLVVAGGVYLAVQPGLYRDGVVALVPRDAEFRTREALDGTGHALGQWLKGQVIAMATIGVLTTFGLWLLGVPSALALGLLAGLAEFVPLVGPIASAIPTLLVASSLGLDTTLYVLGLYVLVQQIESNVVTPLVARKLISIPPALTLFAIVAMALAFGALGLLLASPLTVVLFVLVRKLYVQAALGKGAHASAVAGAMDDRAC
ncbi:AI-2E family transporter [Azospirillum brasilense]|uniref:AI-2E family transporter n=1 Tax=Azospirillum brasilense TaxID=192 RepID=UPI000E681ABF|nr:AI-2E family transporter [Azospirillum brasilense]NUB25203.1 AI-2E family transporter [Azospirillum brasilense]NUB32915.1 AI-2E family transporter [Azospirillum brasilense]RIW02323.1 AI-2E family transporter [Azospirillum brasilense]